jgi:hypothetical protein
MNETLADQIIFETTIMNGTEIAFDDIRTEIQIIKKK